MYCDNTSQIAHNLVQHDRTKHVEMDRHFIKEKLEAGIIVFPFVKSEDQLADVLTKAVANNVFEDSLSKLGMCDIHAPTCGGVLKCILIKLIPFTIGNPKGICYIFHITSPLS